MPVALYALALGGFGIGLTEFGIMGLLPEVAADFGVSESVAGYLISGYALSVAVGAIVLTAALGRVDRKKALLGLLVLFIIGNLMSAVAQTYELMLAGRIVTATSQIATVIALVLMGALGFATVPGLQMRIMNFATGAPTLASGANIAAFNVGNAFGAWVAGLTIAAGLGYASPLWVGALITAAGLLVFLAATRMSGGEYAASGTPEAEIVQRAPVGVA